MLGVVGGGHHDWIQSLAKLKYVTLGLGVHTYSVQGDVVMFNHGDDAEVQAFIDAEDEALNEEERLLMDGPDFEDAIENAFQQGLEAGNAGVGVEINNVSMIHYLHLLMHQSNVC